LFGGVGDWGGGREGKVHARQLDLCSISSTKRRVARPCVLLVARIPCGRMPGTLNVGTPSPSHVTFEFLLTESGGGNCRQTHPCASRGLNEHLRTCAHDGPRTGEWNKRVLNWKRPRVSAPDATCVEGEAGVRRTDLRQARDALEKRPQQTAGQRELHLPSACFCKSSHTHRRVRAMTIVEASTCAVVTASFALAYRGSDYS